MGIRAAIICDALETYGGMEYDSLILAEIFDATVFTPSYDSDKTFKEFKKRDVRETINFDSPSQKDYIRRITHALGYMRTDLSGFDVGISIGMRSHFSSIRNDVPTIWYCLSPSREIYDLKKSTLERLHTWRKPAFRLWSKFLEVCDKCAQRHADFIISQSETVGVRIKRYYGNEPDALIYPPVDLNRFRTADEKADYFIMISRPRYEKRIELILDVFHELPEKRLIVCGGMPRYLPEYEKSLIDRMKSQKNVEYEGEVTDERLADLLAHAKGAINFGMHEDFGLAVPEANASGTPALVPAEGGFRETVEHGKNGALVFPPYKEHLVEYIETWNTFDFDDDLRKYAEKYSVDKFKKKWRDLVEKWIN